MASPVAALSEWLDKVLAAVADGDPARVQLAYAHLVRLTASGAPIDAHVLAELHAFALRAAASGGDEVTEHALIRRVHLLQLELSRHRSCTESLTFLDKT